MGLSGSGINEENHIVSVSWIAWLIDNSIGTILSVPFCPRTAVVVCCWCNKRRYNTILSDVLRRFYPDVHILKIFIIYFNISW